MSEQPHDPHFEQLAAGYFGEVLDEAQQAELKAMLQADDRRVKRFAELAQLDQMINAEIAYQHEAKRFGLSSSPSDSGTSSALVELASLYEDGAQSPVDFAAWRQEKADKAAAVERKIRQKHMLIGSAIAAALLLASALLAVVIAVVIAGNTPEAQIAEQQANEQDAKTPNEPGRFSPDLTRAVATLTSTHDAQWAELDLAHGSALYAGQRLTLTAGLAEITTNHGAIAVLEAPATIELIDRPNALRLHAGKLVGICETESSKGFLVLSPQLDVTDLGTRFGVQVDSEGVTHADVFDGNVLVHSPLADERLIVEAGQGVSNNQQNYSLIQGLSRSSNNYRQALALIDDVPLVDGEGRYHESIPASLAFQAFEDSEHISVFCERRGVAWQKEWAIDRMVGEGLSPGQAVDVYLVQFDPVGSGGLLKGDITRTATVRFNRPVAGLITTGERLDATDPYLGSEESRYPGNGPLDRGIRGIDPEGDAIELSPDGRGLTIQMTAGKHIDQIRILIPTRPEAKADH